MINELLHEIPEDQLSLIKINMELTYEERIIQLQSAVNLIEEMKESLKKLNEN
jgi:hypothetical protein